MPIKKIVQKGVRRCAWQRSLDEVLVAISFMVVLGLITFFYWSKLLIFWPFLVMNVFVHVAVVLRCRRLWGRRIKKWEMMVKWTAIIENAEQFVILSCAPQLFPLGSADTEEESHPLPTTSS